MSERNVIYLDILMDTFVHLVETPVECMNNARVHVHVHVHVLCINVKCVCVYMYIA